MLNKILQSAGMSQNSKINNDNITKDLTSASKHSKLIPIDTKSTHSSSHIEMNSNNIREIRIKRVYEQNLKKQNNDMFNLIYNSPLKRHIKSKTLNRETDEMDKDTDETVVDSDFYDEEDSDDEFHLFPLDLDE